MKGPYHFGYYCAHNGHKQPDQKEHQINKYDQFPSIFRIHYFNLKFGPISFYAMENPFVSDSI